MLVLSRRKNEEVLIGDDVRIVVLEVRGEVVRLGFEARDTIKVHRREVYDAIKNNGLQIHGSCRTVGQTPGQEV